MPRLTTERAGATGSGGFERSWAQALAAASLVLAVCLGATYAFWRQVGADAGRRRGDAVEYQASQIIGHIEARLRRHEQLLRGAAGLAAASDALTREEFHAYVETALAGEHFPELRGIGIAIPVDAARRASVVSQVRAEGLPGYRIQPDEPRPAYAPILYLERSTEDAGLEPGYDLYADPVRHEAMDRAREGASLAMSAMVRVQRTPGGEGRPGIDFFMPFFHGPVVEGMRGSAMPVSGWIFSEVSLHDMMSGLLEEALGDEAASVDMRVYDGAAISERSRLYGVAGDDSAPGASADGALPVLRKLSFGGHHWAVELRALPGSDAQRGDERLLFISLAGAAGSLLLASLAWLLATGRARAHREAARMNQELIDSESRLRELNEDLERRVVQRTRDLESIAERLTISVETSNTGIWDWNLLTQAVHYSPEWTRQIGFEPQEIDATIDAWESRIHPADRERVLKALREHLGKPGTPCEMEFRMRHRDGTYRTMLCRSQTHADGSGRPVRVVGSQLDITDRKRVEDSLLNLTRELREAWRQLSKVEEADRRWLAGELHDSIGAALAALNLNLTIIRERLPEEAKPSLAPRIDDSIALLDQTVESVRGLMAQLRPPVLDDYGLARAVRWYVDQIAARGDLKATFRLTGTEVRFSAEMEITLFRIVQGALTNVVKHAAARQVAVTMDIGPKSLTIVVADDGRGFVVDETQVGLRSPHWGLVTMRERAESIGGHCTFASSPGKGTRVVVEVPV